MATTTTHKPLTYTENGHTYRIVCAFCIAEMRPQRIAVVLKQTSKGPYPACPDHA